MQLYSFYSFPGCLDHFIDKYSDTTIYEQQLLKCFETLMNYYDRKNKEMGSYVQQLADHILLLSRNLTPLL